MMEIGSLVISVPLLWWASRARPLRWLSNHITDGALTVASVLEFPAEVRRQRDRLRQTSDNRIGGPTA